MNRRELSIVGAVVLLMGLTFVIYASPVFALGTTTTMTGSVTSTASTQTITGDNIPDATHISNGVLGLIIPLFFAEMFAFLLRYFDRVGDFHVTVFLLGIALGSLVLLYNTSSNASTGAVPLAFVIVCWIVFGGWIWLGGQGEGSLATGGSG